MDVEIVVFPETKVAALEHFGSPALEHDTVKKLIAWKLERSYLADRAIISAEQLIRAIGEQGSGLMHD